MGFDDFCSLLHKLSVHYSKVLFAEHFQIRLMALHFLPEQYEEGYLSETGNFCELWFSSDGWRLCLAP